MNNWNWTRHDVRKAVIEAFVLSTATNVSLDTSRCPDANEELIVAWAKGMGLNAEIKPHCGIVVITKPDGWEGS